MGKYRVTKVVDGFSTCFRQWKSAPIHCAKLHGYSIYFKLYFETEELDDRNWTIDFGFLKRSKCRIMWKGEEFQPAEWFKYMFDHTVIVASDDPHIDKFKALEEVGALQLRELETVGCEKFAELVYKVMEELVRAETFGRVKLSKVEVFEHEKNSASYGE